jgi:hypothetical protein
MYGGLNAYVRAFWGSALGGGEWSGSRADRFAPEERTIGWGTTLQAARSRVRFPVVSLEFFIDNPCDNLFSQ